MTDQTNEQAIRTLLRDFAVAIHDYSNGKDRPEVWHEELDKYAAEFDQLITTATQAARVDELNGHSIFSGHDVGNIRMTGQQVHDRITELTKAKEQSEGAFKETI